MLATKNPLKLCLTILFLKDERIVLTYLVDLDQDVEGMHAVVVVARLAGAADFPVDADLKVVVERVYKSKEAGRLAIDEVEGDIAWDQKHLF